jgi:hypothetical protein
MPPDQQGGSTLPGAITIGVNRKTGQTYRGFSGEILGKTLPRGIQADELQVRLEQTRARAKLATMNQSESLETWSAENCAEIRASNSALRDGAKMEDLDLYTFRLQPDGTLEAMPRCQNCQITTQGANVPTDLNLEGP